MKGIALFCVSIFILTNLLYSQDIINETGKDGKFIVRDNEHAEVMVIDEGDVSITGTLKVEELEEGSHNNKVVVWDEDDKKFKALYNMIPNLPINPSILAAGSWTEDGSGNIYRATGMVGIGTTTPQRILDINPSVSGSAQLMRESDSDLFAINLKSLSNRGELLLYKDGAITTKITGFGDNYFQGKVGIVTTTPKANLHVSGQDGLLVQGTYGNGTERNLGAGTRMHFYPRKAAFRVGYASGTQWDDSNIGIYSVAMGRDNIASGNYSTAIGDETEASGVSSTTMGYKTTASGLNSIASGYSSTASGYSSTAMGANTEASGYSSTAMGYNTHASGIYSVSLGYATLASGDYSLSMGKEILVSGDHSIGIALNDQNGTLVSQSNTMAIMGGRVGINDKTPDFPLHIYSNDHPWDSKMDHHIKLEVANGWWTIGVDDQANDADLLFRSSEDSDGYTALIDPTTGGYVLTSDKRLKKDIEPLTKVLEKIDRLNPVIYHRLAQKNDDLLEIGFIAQDVHKIFPNTNTAVLKGEYWGLTYDNFGTIAIAGIKELKAKVDEKDQEIDELRTTIKQLFIRIEKLENN